MLRFDVDGLYFEFPENWQVSQYDQWAFYRNQFAKMWNGIKALDLLAVDVQRTAWLIEVKDYRMHSRTKPTELPDEVAQKILHTLSAMLPARLHANVSDEKQLAKAVAAAKTLRVILHLEQPAKHSRLRPRAINPADVQQKLRKLVKPIDAHPRVIDSAVSGFGWQVSRESPKILPA